MEQPAIGDYALIGDGRTAALCSNSGAIDWLCLPRFDSDPVFGRLIGGSSSGSFQVSIEGIRETVRRYRPGGAVLETTWRTGGAEACLTEGTVLDIGTRLAPRMVLVRRLECRSAPVRARILFEPCRGLAGERLEGQKRWGHLMCSRGSLVVALRTVPDVDLEPGREAIMELRPGTSLTLIMTVADREPLVFVPPPTAVEMLESSQRWWKSWSEGIEYSGPLYETVVRSLITLRLLTYAPSGAPVAAPTTSLPEVIEGGRNWDYRYAWPRDAAIGVTAFHSMGKGEEAHSFFHWLLHASRLTRPRLRVLYTIDGKPGPKESELPEAEGYRGSRPVRIGNGAGEQHQLDVYGWVVDSAWSLVRSGRPLHSETWRAVAGLADFVSRHWKEPDAGMWERRGEPAHYTHSKLMGWLALDRAIRIARTHRTRGARIRRWQAARAELASDVRALGFDPHRGCYVGAYGSEHLDAALLVLPLLGFEARDGPRLVRTVEAIQQELSAGGPLLYRYPPGSDGLPGGEGAFLPCSFWLVQALALLGRRQEALELFEDLCRRSNDVGLFAEEIDPATSGHRGNFPQALTHAALIQAALALQDTTEDGGSPPGSTHKRRERPE